MAMEFGKHRGKTLEWLLRWGDKIVKERAGRSFLYSVATLLFVCFGLVLIVGRRKTVAAASTPTYAITMTSSDSSASCYGLNTSGQTTGEANGTEGYFAMVNTGGAIQLVGSLDESDGSFGEALNNSAQVVGWSFTSDNNFVTHNFLYSGGKMIDLYPFAFPLTYSGNIINNSGTIAGYTTSGSTTLATIYSGGKLTTLGTVPGATGSIAVGINDNGDVTGTSGGGVFLYKNGVMENLGQVGTSLPPAISSTMVTR
jgi:probable HAF family extracellular repeat protein